MNDREKIDALQTLRTLIDQGDIKVVMDSLAPTKAIRIAATESGGSFLTSLTIEEDNTKCGPHDLAENNHLFSVQSLRDTFCNPLTDDKHERYQHIDQVIKNARKIYTPSDTYPPLTESYEALCDKFAELVHEDAIRYAIDPKEPNAMEVVATEKGKELFDRLGLKTQLTLEHPEYAHTVSLQELLRYFDMQKPENCLDTLFPLLQLKPPIEIEGLQTLVADAMKKTSQVPLIHTLQDPTQGGTIKGQFTQLE